LLPTFAGATSTRQTTTMAEDDIMALVFGGANVEKTTVIQSSHSESSTHVERVVTVTKSITHDADGDHLHLEVHKANGIEHEGEEAFTHSSATFEAHVETLANGEHHIAVDSVTLHKDVELANGAEAAVEVQLRRAVPGSELGDRSPSRLSTATDATSVMADTYHVSHEEQELNLHLDHEHHEKDHIPFRTSQQDALVAQFKELHHAPPSLPTSLPPSEHVSRRGTYIEEHSIFDDPIEIDREHELERIRVEAEKVAELKRTLSKASDHPHAHHHYHIHRTVEDDSSDEEGSVVRVSATHYEFDDRASIVRTESFVSHHSAKRDSIDLYNHDNHHESLAAASDSHVAEQHVEPMIGSGVAPIHVQTPVTSPLTESVFMSPVSPVPHDHYESDIESRASSLNPQFTGPHITDELKAVEVLEHHDHHHHHHHLASRHDSITSAGAVVRALEEMDAALQHHSSVGSERGGIAAGSIGMHNSSSVPPSPAPSRDDGSYSLNGSVRHKHHLYERLGSYSRASTPISGPPPPVPLWDLIKEEEVARAENVIDAPAPLHRAAPLSHLEEISSKNSVTTDVHHHDHHGSKTSLIEAAALVHHVHEQTASPQPSVRSSRYGSRHSVVNGTAGIGAGVAPIDRKSSVISNDSCKSRGTTITLVDDGNRSRGSTLTEANVNGIHEHHHHITVGEAVAAHLIHEHIEHKIEEEVIKREIAHQIHQQEQQSVIEYERQKSVASLMSQFGGGDRKAYTKEEADVRRRAHEAAEAARLAHEHAAREAERR
ncbi:hypothetical protein PFISCL1PPCAC_28032, partial [Pristionchus fissidentatus]